MKFIQDRHNNLGRYCNVQGMKDEQSRIWKVERAMEKLNDYGTYYLLKNKLTGKYITASCVKLYNLY